MQQQIKISIVIFVMLTLVFIIPAGMALSEEPVPAWQANTYYSTGVLVTYGSQTYQCRQSHTSLTGWEPPNVLALWLPVGSSNTPTRTNTVSNATRTLTGTPTPAVSGSGNTCWTAWVATLVYTAGAQVSYNNRNYQAAYWNQNQRPDLNSGVPNSGQPWIIMQNCSNNTTPTPPPTPVVTAHPTPTPTFSNISSSKVIGYFVQWGVYTRNYHVKNIVTSGSAAKLTHIMYAFGNVQNGQCVVGDSYADYDRFYSAAESVDGVADTWDTGALRGNFNQLRKLKQMYPHIKVIWSFGGWTWSAGFSQAAANPTAFADSCYKLVKDSRWADVFDGVDIDWEYPNACGLTCDTSGFASYRNLMAALRARFGSGNLVTAAIPAGYANINAADYGGAAQYVDWYMVMTYDFFGAWASTGPTAPHSPLYDYAGIPQAGFYSDSAIQLLKSKGIASNKLLLGVGFYGRGWSGVPATNGGLNQTASGAAPGTYEQGIEDYKVLAAACPPTGTVAGTAYAYCSGQWWSYDTPATLAGKMSYIKSQGLGGVFCWEFSGDTSNGALITALYNNR